MHRLHFTDAGCEDDSQPRTQGILSRDTASHNRSQGTDRPRHSLIMVQPIDFAYHTSPQGADLSSLFARVTSTPFWVYVFSISTPAPSVGWLVLKA